MELDKTTRKKLIWWLVGVIAFIWLLCNLSLTARILGNILGLLSPFITGITIAFVLNVPMVLLEKKLFANFTPFGLPGKRFKRPVALAVTLTAFGGVLAAVLFWVLPGIARSLSALAMQLPGLLQALEEHAGHLGERYPQLAQWLTDRQWDIQNLEATVIEFFQEKASSMLGSTLEMLGAFVNGITNFSLGLVFAFYLLLQKEKLGRQGKKILRAFLPTLVTEKILSFLSLCNKTFSGFLSGQCLESFLLGSMFFAVMSLLQFPYALMTGLIMAVTSLIPIFGAIIGCLGGMLLMWIAEPDKTLWFLLLFFVLQQIEGNFIYPHVVGNSVGLPAIWVLTAVTLGGGIGGIFGMFLSIPLASVFYSLLKQEVRRKEKEKRQITRKKEESRQLASIPPQEGKEKTS